MDPQQAPLNVAPLVTLCTTRFAALPGHPTSPTNHSTSSISPVHPRHLHRSLTESDATPGQPHLDWDTEPPGAANEGRADPTPTDGERGVHATLQQAGVPGSEDAQPSQNMENGEDTEGPLPDNMQPSSALDSNNEPAQLAPSAPTAAASEAAQPLGQHLAPEGLPGSYLRSRSDDPLALSQSDQTDAGLAAEGDVTDQGVTIDKNHEVDMVASSSDLLPDVAVGVRMAQTNAGSTLGDELTRLTDNTSI